MLPQATHAYYPPALQLCRERQNGRVHSAKTNESMRPKWTGRSFPKQIAPLKPFDAITSDYLSESHKKPSTQKEAIVGVCEQRRRQR